jgi:hypothetical protein
MTAIRITGSASMKNGYFPEVMVTIADESRIRHIPVARMIRGFWNLCFRCEIT